MYTDTHVHTDFSGDCECSAREQLDRALALGMKSICITDHHDFDVMSDIDFELDIPRYLEKMSELRAEYEGRLNILTGIELGLQTHIAGYLSELTEKYPFDYIIGSVHFIDGLDPYFPEYFDTHRDNAYERFFEMTLENIRKIKRFDSLGHLDYIVRYGKGQGLDYSYEAFREYIDPILETLIRDGKALECNTGGLSRGLAETNPCSAVLKRYRELGGELVTIGSDAHSPETLGFAFKETGGLLRTLGFKYYTVYRERKPCLLPL